MLIFPCAYIFFYNRYFYKVYDRVNPKTLLHKNAFDCNVVTVNQSDKLQPIFELYLEIS